MTISSRPYRHETDFNRVGDFLVEHYQSGNRDGNWLQPAWEYMHSHSSLDRSTLDRIRIWEDDEVMVAIAHYESTPGEAFFQVHPNYEHLKPEMLDYAERSLKGTCKDGELLLRVYINDFDKESIDLMPLRGYRKEPEYNRPMLEFSIPDPFPEIKLPVGYRLISLQEDNDLHKINRVLWRGFNHAGEAPEEDIPERAYAQATANFRKDLTTVVKAPDGSFISYCGVWLDPGMRYCYIEPVATDPDHRRMGLGKAAVLEGIRHCALMGIPTAYVWNELEIYTAIGFKMLHTSQCWVKRYA
jgi:GNAT superfamily N-acetyltransferase